MAQRSYSMASLGLMLSACYQHVHYGLRMKNWMAATIKSFGMATQ
jgi:hypothetical protein